MTVQLIRDYKVKPYASVVKIAGTKVGVVRSVSEPDGAGPVELTLKVDNGTRALLGTEPRAVLRPTTVLGGAYYVQLYPGGQKGTAPSDVIPANRTALPVELDRLLSAIPPDARRGLQGMTERLDSTLKAGTGDKLDQVLADAPATLGPTAVVADALRGVNKDVDLSSMIINLNAASRILTQKPAQLRSVVDSLAVTSRVLGDNAGALDRTFASLPATMRETRDGAHDLGELMDKLHARADDARPTVRALDPLLKDLDPTLADLHLLLPDLRDTLEDAKPLVQELVPTVDVGTDVLRNLDGKVLDRVNGPIQHVVNSEWHGQAPKYPNGGGDGATFYQELAYLVANIDSQHQAYNATSHLFALGLGAGSTSLYGDGPAAQGFQDQLSEMYGRPHQPGKSPLALPPRAGVAAPDPGIEPPVINTDKGANR
jgi:phospholipid/cholesterol/gamma-HCH transport system substrate-binding protein